MKNLRNYHIKEVKSIFFTCIKDECISEVNNLCICYILYHKKSLSNIANIFYTKHNILEVEDSSIFYHKSSITTLIYTKNIV
jgi:hypothetical protein